MTEAELVVVYEAVHGPPDEKEVRGLRDAHAAVAASNDRVARLGLALAVNGVFVADDCGVPPADLAALRAFGLRLADSKR